LTAAGFDVLLDDREDRAGVKFKDADLVGVPYRVNVGKKVSECKVEVVQRSTRQSVDASMAEIAEKLRQIMG
jgi:prolyl-tRNA synthetase